MMDAYAGLGELGIRETRRAFLGRASMGLGGLALSSLLDPKLQAAQPGISGFPNYNRRLSA